MNLLIAIMGNAYNKVDNIGENANYRELCALISENEFLVNRE